jgi:ABC-type multidrug transport system fused ATPase/permease subunit
MTRKDTTENVDTATDIGTTTTTTTNHHESKEKVNNMKTDPCNGDNHDNGDDDELKNTIHGTSIDDQQKPVPLLKLIGLAYPERFMLSIALIFMIAGEGLGLVTPLIIADAYDALVNPYLSSSQRMSSINHTMTLVLVIHIAGILSQYIRASIMGAAGVRIVARTRNRLYECIMKQEIAFFDVTKTGELVSRLGSDTGLLEEGISTALPEVIIGFIVATVSIAIMLWISWQLALMMIGFLFIILLICVPFGTSLGKLSKSYQDSLGLAQTHSTEALGAIRTVQSFAAEEKELHRYTDVIGKPEQYKYWWPIDHKEHKTTYSFGIFKSLTQVALFIIIFGIGFGALYVILWYGLKLVVDGDLTLGKLTAFQSYIFQVGGKLGQTSQFIAKLIETQGAASRLFYLLQRVPAIPTPYSNTDNNDPKESHLNKSKKNEKNDDEEPNTPRTLASVQGAVDFNNVSFAYPSRPNTTVLKNFSLSILPNQTAALVGASGAGTYMFMTCFCPLLNTIIILIKKLKLLQITPNQLSLIYIR